MLIEQIASSTRLEQYIMLGLPLTEILTLIGFLFTIIGLFFTGLQIRQNTKLQRARFLIDIVELYFQDKDIRDVFYQIDYNRFSFDESTFVLGDKEQAVDRLLYTLDAIGRIVELGALTPQEIDVLAFQILRVMDNKGIQDYLAWLTGEYENRSHVPPHRDAQRLAERLRHLLKERVKNV